MDLQLKIELEIAPASVAASAARSEVCLDVHDSSSFAGESGSSRTLENMWTPGEGQSGEIRNRVGEKTR
jgi:hypothetical protein